MKKHIFLKKSVKRVLGGIISFSLVILVFSFAGYAGCAGCNVSVNTPELTLAPTATAAPTQEVMLTPTVAPSETPVPTPTEEPAIIEEVEPTAEPVPTEEPTPTPAPTSTPVPTIAVAEDAKLLGTAKMGDNVFYDLYDDGTLVVRGTGATMDFKNAIRMDDYFNEQVTSIKAPLATVTAVIIKEGVTGIGKSALAGMTYATKIVFPKSLKKIDEKGFYGTGLMIDYTEYIGLDVDAVEIASTAFWDCRSPENIPDGEKYTLAPTPTPAPTATPVPDPDKPRMYASKQMGDNVTFEFYDNGILYVKGEGASWDKDYTFMDFMKEPYCNTHTVIVEDGITYLGDDVFNFMWNITYYQLPKSLTNAGNTAGGGTDVTIDGYLDGKAVTVKVKLAGSLDSTFFGAVKAVELGIREGCEIIYH